MRRLARTPYWLLLSLLVLLTACEPGRSTGLPMFGGGGAGSTPGDGNNPAPSGFSGSIFTLTNGERAKVRVRAVTYSSTLQRAAQLQADQIASTGVFAHDIPSGPYPMLSDRLKAASYQYTAAAENIALVGSTWTAADVIAAWMNSPSHAATIMSETYTELGIGTATAKDGMRIVVQVFGAR